MTIVKPSLLEDEYFAREDAERIRQLHYDEIRRLKEHEKDERRHLHQGHCSECGMRLVPEKIEEVIVYHCLSCGGAFLPRRSWETLHKSAAHGAVDAVLNWFRQAANTP